MKIDPWINRIILGDCKKIMLFFPSESVDCVVTDPPYGISFMGKNWDKALPEREAFKQIFRVLKSGGLAFVMSSPRQDVLWRMLKMLEEVGFELRQSFVAWIYKSGFPKAHDVSLGIDKKFIQEEFIAEHGRKPTKEELKALLKEKRKIIGKSRDSANRIASSKTFAQIPANEGEKYLTQPASDLAKKWQGWKSITGLKPALECILMVNKPLSEKTIVDNVLKHGTGAINVDATRIPYTNKKDFKYGHSGSTSAKRGHDTSYSPPCSISRIGNLEKGRFPANLLVSDQALSCFKYFDLDKWSEHHGFLDVAKASKRERNVGLEENPKQIVSNGRKKPIDNPFLRGKTLRRNIHPTVKPVKLMAYLVELGCPKEGIVLDPYVGSGTTCIASKKLGRKYIGIEINREYAEIAKARLRMIWSESKLLERK